MIDASGMDEKQLEQPVRRVVGRIHRDGQIIEEVVQYHEGGMLVCEPVEPQENPKG